MVKIGEAMVKRIRITNTTSVVIIKIIDFGKMEWSVVGKEYKSWLSYVEESNGRGRE
jgi:hypothetical protein